MVVTYIVRRFAFADLKLYRLTAGLNAHPHKDFGLFFDAQGVQTASRCVCTPSAEHHGDAGGSAGGRNHSERRVMNIMRHVIRMGGVRVCHPHLVGRVCGILLLSPFHHCDKALVGCRNSRGRESSARILPSASCEHGPLFFAFWARVFER